MDPAGEFGILVHSHEILRMRAVGENGYHDSVMTFGGIMNLHFPVLKGTVNESETAGGMVSCHDN